MAINNKHVQNSCHGCHGNNNDFKVPEGAKKIVLVGNPNVGKSVFFHALTGVYVEVSNFPGTTIEITKGAFAGNVVIDTPGVYGVSSFNDEEMAARDVILGADIIINVVDAVHLERDLFLTLQCIDMGIPMIVVLNMMDEVEKQGINIDVDLLSFLLGVPVIAAAAVKNKGIEKLKESISKARKGNTDPDLAGKLDAMLSQVNTQAEALLIREGDLYVAGRYGLQPMTEREDIYMSRRRRVNEIIDRVFQETNKGASFSVLLGRAMLRPITGVPILFITLFVMYKVIGGFIAGTVVGITEGTIMRGVYEPAIVHFTSQFISPNSIIGDVLIGKFGLLTMTPVYIIGLLLPLVLGFYFFLSVLEDSGYLPRIAALVDRLLTGIGLNGRAVIPIILGFGCVTLATITTRLLGTKREKTIATVLLGLTIPCSAQLGVIAGMLAGIGAKYTLLYIGVILGVFILAGTVLNRMLEGQSSDLLIDLPALRLPRVDNVAKKTWLKSFSFLKEATPLFAAGTFLISVLQITGSLDFIQNLMSPLTSGWLKMPKGMATVFIMGMIRRDFGAAGLSSMGLSPVQATVGLITITLFVPCIAAILVIFKERGSKEGAAIWGGSWIAAFLVGGIVAQILI